MQIEYVSWACFARLAGILYRRIDTSGYRPDMIIAITRGGYPVARVLADYFGVMELVTLKIEHYRGPDKLPAAVVRYSLPATIDDRRVLLVDDVSDSGDTFSVALPHLDSKGVPAALRTAVLHYKLSAEIEPDYFAQRVRKWRWITYPWAVTEDLNSLVQRLEDPPRTKERLRELLRQHYDLQLPERVFREVAPIVLARVHGARRDD